MQTTLRALISKIQSGIDLSESESEAAIGEILQSCTSPEELKGFLLALRTKGESLSEVVGAARAMRRQALSVKANGRMLIDTCGTGGDGLKTVNISTMAALVVAGCGVPVAKHGNRSITSASGSADLLEALGVKIDVDVPLVERCLQEACFGFLFAPRFHPAMKRVAPIRKELGVPTIFNLLGPLTNPAGVRHQIVGVADPGRQELYAKALMALGGVRALVVHGADGQDELSTTGPTEVVEFNTQQDPDRVAHYTVTPGMFGIRLAELLELKGGSPLENARIAQELLAGKPGAVRDAVLFNAAAALYVAGAVGDLDGGLSLSTQSLDRGRALAVLQMLRRITQG